MLSFVIIATGSVLLFVLYQRRLSKKQEELYAQDSKHKKDLITNAIQSTEIERMRIAKDIHDEIGSIFSSLSLAVNQIKKEDPLLNDQVQASKGLIQTGINSVRRISHAIAPFELELLGLEQTLENHFNSISSLSSLTINFQNNYKLDLLNNDTAVAIYRIIQELMSNCIKHAQAKTIIVSFNQNDSKNHLSVIFSDDGIGRDMESKKLKNGIGLKNIESRVIAVEGTVKFNSEPTKGFECELMIPLNKTTLK